jgi:hypothetical protein
MAESAPATIKSRQPAFAESYGGHEMPLPQKSYRLPWKLLMTLIFEQRWGIHANTAPSSASGHWATPQETPQGLEDAGSRCPDACGHHDLRFNPGRLTVVAGRRNLALLKATG